MPNVKDHKKRTSKEKMATELEESLDTAPMERAKRRPGREAPEASTAQVRVVDVETGLDPQAAEALSRENLSSGSEATAIPPNEEELAGHASDSEAHFEADPSKPKVELRFFGSELLRARFSKPFDVAEAVATDWVHGGDFAQLPIEHPLAQFVAQKGLQKAKEVEKKVLESPVTEKVAMQVLTAGMKAQGVIEQIRSKLNRKDS